jgi:hypothetical protein
LREKRAVKSAAWDLNEGHHSAQSFSAQRKKRSSERDNNHSRKDAAELRESASTSDESDNDPWASWKNKSGH